MAHTSPAVLFITPSKNLSIQNCKKNPAEHLEDQTLNLVSRTKVRFDRWRHLPNFRGIFFVRATETVSFDDCCCLSRRTEMHVADADADADDASARSAVSVFRPDSALHRKSFGSSSASFNFLSQRFFFNEKTTIRRISAKTWIHFFGR